MSEPSDWRDVVIFDGQCRFCTAQVDRLRKWDRGNCLEFLSLHDPQVGRRFPDLTHEQLMAEMYVVDRSGRRHAGADAVQYLSRRLPRLWLLAPVLHIPGMLPLWRWAYRQIARRRYRFAPAAGCETDVCRIHFENSKRPPT